jgi:hypothetical protein
MADCLETLRSNTVNTTFAQFRRSYLDYLARNWGQDFGAEGRMIQRDVKEMVKINNEYWSPRELTSIPELADADVMTPIEKSNVRVVNGGQVVSTKVGFAGGRLKLGRS